MVLGEKHGTNYLPYTLRTYHKIKKKPDRNPLPIRLISHIRNVVLFFRIHLIYFISPLITASTAEVSKKFFLLS